MGNSSAFYVPCGRSEPSPANLKRLATLLTAPTLSVRLKKRGRPSKAAKREREMLAQLDVDPANVLLHPCCGLPLLRARLANSPPRLSILDTIYTIYQREALLGGESK